MMLTPRALLAAACLAAASLSGGLAFAQEGQTLVLTSPINLKAPGANEAAPTHRPEFKEKTLTIDEAKEFLGTAEGKEWSVLQVQAAACEKNKGKQCKEFTKKCKEADKFAHKYGKHATCSALYTQTKVLLIPADVAPKR